MGLFSRKNKKEKPSNKAQVDEKNQVKDSEQSQGKGKKADSKPTKAVSKKKDVKVQPKTTKVDDKKAISAYRVLIRPIISEKTTMGASLNKYIFEVAARANKVEIKQAVQEAYGVKPVAVNIIKSRGKFVRRGRQVGRTKDVKKAIVTLAKGDSIKLYEGI